MEFRLKELRKRRKISQLKLALDLNMNQNTISRYENLEREADYRTLVLFADYFDKNTQKNYTKNIFMTQIIMMV